MTGELEPLSEGSEGEGHEVHLQKGEGKRVEQDLEVISQQINKVQWSLINKQKFYNQIIQNQRKLLKEQERIIKHLTKKLGLTKLDLERIQHEAIAKVPNVSSKNVEDDSDSAIVLDSSYSEENKENSDGKSSSSDSSLKLERSVSDVLRITVEGNYCEKSRNDVSSGRRKPDISGRKRMENTKDALIIPVRTQTDIIYHNKVTFKEEVEEFTRLGEHIHQPCHAPRPRLRRSHSEKVVDKEGKEEKEENLKEAKGKGETTNLRRCESEKIIRSSFSSPLYRGFLLRHRRRTKKFPCDIDGVSGERRVSTLIEKDDIDNITELKDGYKASEYRELYVHPTNHKSVLTPREVKNRNRRKTVTHFHSLTHIH